MADGDLYGRFYSAEEAEKILADKQKNSSGAQKALDLLGGMGAKLNEAYTSGVEQAKQMHSQLTADQLRRQSEELLGSLAQDGYLSADQLAEAKQPATPAAPQASFTGLAAEVKKQVLGQDIFVDSLVKAFRRPFVLGTDKDLTRAKNLIFVSGPSGTGRHYTVDCVVKQLAARGLVHSAALVRMDLSLYPGPAQEKLFLQDLYSALQASAEVIEFDGLEQCHASYLNMLSTLCVTGSLPLTSRYVLQKNILVDVGTALAPTAESRLYAGGKYMVFFSTRDEGVLMDKLGAKFVDALLGDTCTTVPYTPESLNGMAAQQLNNLAIAARDRCGLTVTMDAAVRDLTVAQYGRTDGMQAIMDFVDRAQRALAEYVLDQTEELPKGTPVALSARDGVLMAAFRDEPPMPLFSLLPAEYKGDVAAVEAELDEIVGLDEIKTYVRGLADNVKAQQRRKTQGLKVANLNMHMIFTGNPGTGKTTIARIVSKYLKAIGALRGGQLVEVTRADLVGRYVGHTAPLTNQVIQSALGGVLFIDEAYSLYRGRDDSFGLEAIDTLVKGIEDHRDELVVILAGYSNEMAVFLQGNSGLASRFPNHIEFPDYTAAELLAITKSIAKSKGYALQADCDAPLTEYYDLRQRTDPATAGNGRMARNLLEKAILNQSKRLVADPDAPLDLLQKDDFDLEKDAN